MTFSPLILLSSTLLVLLLIAQYAIAYFRSPLRKLPGPFLARFTNLWRFLSHYRRAHIENQAALHKKYGSAVRIGPNIVSLSDPSLLKTIYSTRGTFPKSDFYSINDALQDGKLIQNIFSTRDNAFHARAIKPVQKLYSLNNALELESLMNSTIQTLCSELETRFMTGPNAGKTCDISDWISYFAWDFLGDMTFSQHMGFMSQGSDVDNILSTGESVMSYFSVIGQVPRLDKWLGKNPYLPYKFPDVAITASFCIQRFLERIQDLPALKDKKDFINGFLAAQTEYPDLIGDNEVIGYLILHILGGADTTAILLKAIVYHLLKTPHAKERLVDELRVAGMALPAPYAVVNELPYLGACIKEGLRIHPVLGHMLERVVPSTGLTLPDSDITIPPGTIVGMNPWVVQRDEKIFGAKADEFVPERWLQGKAEDKDAYEARTRRMKNVDLSFGMGSRVCMGKPLATVELHKVIATLFGRYNIELEDPSQKWELHKQWFVWPHNIKVKMTLYQSEAL